MRTCVGRSILMFYLRKISKAIGSMNRLKSSLPQTILQTLYNSFVLPYLNYAILSWGLTSAQCNRVLLLQKRAVRIITKNSYMCVFGSFKSIVCQT